MPKEGSRDPGADVDRRSELLIAAFQAHYQEVRQRHPEATDKRPVFEGWAIQKIAGLQISVEHLADVVNRLTDAHNRLAGSVRPRSGR